jgi:predicted RNase H-like nuclease (RuvC/YqgF family)
MSYIKDLTLKEMSKMLEDTVKENRALELEMMEQACEISQLRSQVKLFRIGHGLKKQIITDL